MLQDLDDAVFKYGYKIRRIFRRRSRKHMAIAPGGFSLRSLPPEDRRPDVAAPRIAVATGPGREKRARREVAFQVHWRGDSVIETLPWGRIADRWAGRTALVACSGPSLSTDLLHSMRGRAACIAVNGAIEPLAREGIAPDAYAVTDPDFARGRFPLLRTAIESSSLNFLSFAVLGQIVRRDPGILKGRAVVLTDLINHFWDRDKLSEPEFHLRFAADRRVKWHPFRHAGDAVGFSFDPALGLFCGRTIAFRAVQIARYLGCDRIILTGMDLHAPPSAPRIYDEAGRPRPTRLDADYENFILPSFQVAADLAARQGWQLINASPGSRLPSSVVPVCDPLQLIAEAKAA